MLVRWTLFTSQYHTQKIIECRYLFLYFHISRWIYQVPGAILYLHRHEQIIDTEDFKKIAVNQMTITVKNFGWKERTNFVLLSFILYVTYPKVLIFVYIWMVLEVVGGRRQYSTWPVVLLRECRRSLQRVSGCDGRTDGWRLGSSDNMGDTEVRNMSYMPLCLSLVPAIWSIGLSLINGLCLLSGDREAEGGATAPGGHKEGQQNGRHQLDSGGCQQGRWAIDALSLI